MRRKREYRWERYAEYQALQQYSRCLGAALASMPTRLGRKAAKPLIRASVMMGTLMTFAHAEEDPAHPIRLAARRECRDTALQCVELSREGLLALKELASTPHVTAALELLERIESGLRERPLPGSVPAAGTGADGAAGESTP